MDSPALLQTKLLKRFPKERKASPAGKRLRPAASFPNPSGRAAETLLHDFLERKPRRGEGAACAQAIALRQVCRTRFLTVLQCARAFQHETAKAHYCDIGDR